MADQYWRCCRYQRQCYCVSQKLLKPIPSSIVIDKIVVDKSSRTLQLISQGTAIRAYRIALGGNPVGHKQQEGDQRTPTGIYTLDYKNERSIAHRSIHISYPNAADKARKVTGRHSR
ncbi:murein L,D-transpeptidase family protein [Psychrobacter sp.]|uniref:L,D-transpeptidase family protein n=1 Tax=Psychrobacter sp. TaxID=56811 RepID=UPI00346302EB